MPLPDRLGYGEDVASTGDRKRILFLCTGNAARSQMAEALARIDYGDLVDPVSAGSRPAGFVHPLAIHAIEELGFGMAAAHSKGAEEFRESRFDLVVTVCASAAADCPTWPGARHLVHWAIEDPSFVKGGDQARLDAFRATREELRQRIDSLMEALRRAHPRRTDGKLLEEGAHLLVDVLKPHGFRLGKVYEEEAAGRKHAVVRFDRRGRSLELQVRSGVTLAAYVVGEYRLLHPHYMERLGVAALMRYPGLSKDPLDAFRRLRADIVRFGGSFLTGSGIKEFRRLARAKSA
jgi:arsenate reductase (thioredoxin)